MRTSCIKGIISLRIAFGPHVFCLQKVRLSCVLLSLMPVQCSQREVCANLSVDAVTVAAESTHNAPKAQSKGSEVSTWRKACSSSVLALLYSPDHRRDMAKDLLKEGG